MVNDESETRKVEFRNPHSAFPIEQGVDCADYAPEIRRGEPKSRRILSGVLVIVNLRGARLDTAIRGN